MNKLSEIFFSSGAILQLDADRFALGWGRWHWSSAPDAQRPSYYCPDFFLHSQTPWFSPDFNLELSRADLTAEVLAFREMSPPLPLALTWEDPEFQEFEETFDRLPRLFEGGTLRKGVPVVFSRSKRFACSPSRLAELLANCLERATGSSRIYGFWNGQEGCLGATPELLFEQPHPRLLRTMALAGTRALPAAAGGYAPNGGGAEAVAIQGAEAEDVYDAEFLADPKERAEHQWVIQDIEASLAPHAEVRVEETEVIRLPRLAHLRTQIVATPHSGRTFEEWVQTLHPTAALGAFPRAAGLRWLREQESRPLSHGYSRARFGAPFGWQSPHGEAICRVAIRGVQWRKQELLLGTGCGIIPESILKREWAELALKRQSVRGMLGI